MKSYEVTHQVGCTVYVEAESEEAAYEIAEQANFGDCEHFGSDCRELSSEEIDSSRRHANVVVKAD